MASTDRFGYEWHKYDYLIDQYEEQFLKWVNPLQKSDFENKSIVDAGCGMGRNSYWCLKYGAANVLSFDFDKRSVEAAKETLKEFQNTEVHYGDINSFQVDDRFDYVISIGVIHHLSNPEQALRNIAKMLKPGGKILIWVYGYEGNEWIVKYINPLRIHITSRLPIGMTHMFSYFLSSLLYIYLKIVPQNRPYLKLLKKFGFHHVHSIVFDHLLPKIANYWTKDEVRALVEQIPGIRSVQVNPVNHISWTAVGTVGSDSEQD